MSASLVYGNVSSAIETVFPNERVFKSRVEAMGTKRQGLLEKMISKGQRRFNRVCALECLRVIV